MTDEKWQETKGKIKDTFDVLDERTEDLIDEPGTAETIEFVGPLGRMRLERVTKPVVIGERAIGARRIGSQKTVQKEYSPDEKVHYIKAYKFDEATEEWVEIEIEPTLYST
ncbi:MAG: hypothetical protein WC497_04140 [Patescibacteria group bacterium]